MVAPIEDHVKFVQAPSYTRLFDRLASSGGYKPQQRLYSDSAPVKPIPALTSPNNIANNLNQPTTPSAFSSRFAGWLRRFGVSS